jgi:hypothetical protein
MTDDQSKPGTSAAVVIVVALLVLVVPCLAGLLLLGGTIFYARLQAPQPIPLPPVPGANAPLPVPTLPGPTMPTPGSISVNNLSSSQNLFDAADEVLTLAKYEQIQPGMTYDQLVGVLEIPEGKCPTDIDLVGPQSDVELKWFGGENDATSITVKLKGKTVVNKSQTGLK